MYLWCYFSIYILLLCVAEFWRYLVCRCLPSFKYNGSRPPLVCGAQTAKKKKKTPVDGWMDEEHLINYFQFQGELSL